MSLQFRAQPRCTPGLHRSNNQFGMRTPKIHEDYALRASTVHKKGIITESVYTSVKRSSTHFRSSNTRIIYIALSTCNTPRRNLLLVLEVLHHIFDKIPSDQLLVRSLQPCTFVRRVHSCSNRNLLAINSSQNHARNDDHKGSSSGALYSSSWVFSHSGNPEKNTHFADMLRRVQYHALQHTVR